MPKTPTPRTWALPLRSNGLRFSRAPITPPTLSAVVDSSSQITVTASGSTSTLGTVSTYRWRRNGVLLNGGTPSASPLVSSGLSAGTLFQFSATAVDSAGNESALSNVVSATTTASGDSTAPSVPGSHNMSVINSNTLRSAWVASTDTGGSGLAGYLVERATSAGGPWTQVTPAPITAATFDHTGLPSSTTFFARVRAVDNAGNPSDYSLIASATTASTSSLALTPSLVAEYVDAAGVFQSITVNANGSTVISGVAPFLVHFDATGSRGNLSNNNTLAGAFYNLGYRLNYGENRGGLWTYGLNNSRDEDRGPPIFGHAYEVVGSHVTRLRVRDTNGQESTLTLTVNVAAPPAPIIIEPSAGSFPTPVSGTHYRLRGGQSYAGFGEWNLRRVHNVLVSKEGGGADPIAQIRIGGEDIGDLMVARERARHVRLLNIDVTRLTTGIYGPLNSGAINGRVRRVDQDNSRASYQGTTTETQRTQVLWPRNFFMYNTGLTSESGLPDYLMIGQHYRGWHMQGCRLQHPGGGANNHILRNIQHRSTVRNCQIFSTYAPYASRIKMQAEGTALWAASTDYVGPLSGPGGVGSATRYSNSFVVVESVQFGGPGDQPPFGTTISFAPQNDVAGQQEELHEYITVENCQDTRPAASVVRGGRWLGARGLRNPNSTPWQTNETNNGLNRIPADARGPYVTETDNARPIPSEF